METNQRIAANSIRSGLKTSSEVELMETRECWHQFIQI